MKNSHNNILASYFNKELLCVFVADVYVLLSDLILVVCLGLESRIKLFNMTCYNDNVKALEEGNHDSKRSYSCTHTDHVTSYSGVFCTLSTTALQSVLQKILSLSPVFPHSQSHK